MKKHYKGKRITKNKAVIKKENWNKYLEEESMKAFWQKKDEELR